MGGAKVTRGLRRLLYRTDVGACAPSRQAQALAEAKVLADHLIPELATIKCSPIVMGTALAIVVGAVAAQIRVAARDDFYERFLSAARACEDAMDERARETLKH